MAVGWNIARVGCILLGLCTGLEAQVTVSGRVVDETGAGIEGARVEFQGAAGQPAVASFGPGGEFSGESGGRGRVQVRAERQGFYVYRGKQAFGGESSHLTVTLNHVQEFSEKVDVTASPPPPSIRSSRRNIRNW